MRHLFEIQNLKRTKLRVFGSLFLMAFCFLVSTSVFAQTTEYWIEAKSADRYLAGSDNTVRITMVGKKGRTEPFSLRGQKKRGKKNAYQYTKKDVGNITEIILDLKYDLIDPWEPQYIKISKGPNVSSTSTKSEGGYFEFVINEKLFKSPKTFKPNSNSVQVVYKDGVPINNSEIEVIAFFANNTGRGVKTVFDQQEEQQLTSTVGISKSTKVGAGAWIELAYESPETMYGKFSGKAGASWEQEWLKAKKDEVTEFSMTNINFAHDLQPGEYIFRKITLNTSYVYQKYIDDDGNSSIIKKRGKATFKNGSDIDLVLPKIHPTTGKTIVVKWQEIEENWLPLLNEIDRKQALYFKQEWINQKWVSDDNAPNPPKTNTIALKTVSNHYISAKDGGGSAVAANRTKVGTWETFTMEELGNNKVAIKTHTGHYLSAKDGGGSTLAANRTKVGRWETFTKIDLGNNKIALKTHTGHYVAAEKGGGGAVNADRTERKNWETFTVVRVNK